MALTNIVWKEESGHYRNIWIGDGHGYWATVAWDEPNQIWRWEVSADDDESGEAATDDEGKRLAAESLAQMQNEDYVDF